jgi:membrane protease YdiL (CAAX protease family)
MSASAREQLLPIQPIASRLHTAGLVSIIAICAGIGRVLVGNAPATQLESIGRTHIYLIALSYEWILYFYVRLGLRTESKTVRQIIDERSWSFGRWCLYALIACAAAVAWMACGWGLGHVLHPAQEKINHLMTLLPRTMTEKILWVALSASAGFCEEFIYRGYLLKQFRTYTGSLVAAIVLQSMVYGMAHAALPWEVAVSVTCLGVVFGATAVLSKSLAPGMLFHGGFDILPGILFRP